MRDVVGGERDQADRAFGVDRAEPFDDARRRQAEAPLAQHLERDELAVLAPPPRPGGMKISRCGAALLDRQRAAAAGLELAIDAERRARARARGS